MPARATTRRILATVLFTDIVGSTERAAALGDREWRRLIARHHAIVRRELKRFHGREMDTAGDGFFAAFEQPAEAIYCAAAAAERLRPLGLTIRAGVHMGQVEVGPQKVEGLAVNIGARVAATAVEDQILVSSTVRDALAGSDLTFEDEGRHDLKGVPESWQLYAVRKDDRLLDDAGVLTIEAEPEPGEPRTRRRGWIVAASAAVVVLAVAALMVFVVLDGDGFQPAPDTLAALSAGDGEVVGGTPVGADPAALAADGSAVWVGSADDRTLQRVDPSSLEVTDTKGLASDASPTSIAVGGGYVWVTSSTGEVTYRVRPDGSEIREVPGSATVVAWGDDAAWTTSYNREVLSRIDPRTLEVTELPLPAGSGPRGLAVADGVAWIAGTLSDTVLRVDLEGGEVTEVPAPGGPLAVAVGEGYVWVTLAEDDAVRRIDPDTNQATTVAVGDEPVAITTVDGAAWVACHDGTVRRIEAADATVRTFRIGSRPQAIAAAGDRVYVALGG